MARDVPRTAVILDDHPLWLGALALLLEGASIEVVGRAQSAEEALALIDETRPDLFLADLRLNGGMSGTACIRQAIQRHPDITAVVISAYDDPRSIEESLSAGAAAFVSKTADPDDVSSAIRQVFNHSVFLANRLAREVRRGGQSERLPGLTRREAEILTLVSAGYSNAQAAARLWVTEQTVKFHLSNIYRKLGVSNRTEASHWALTRDLNGDGPHEAEAPGLASTAGAPRAEAWPRERSRDKNLPE